MEKVKQPKVNARELMGAKTPYQFDKQLSQIHGNKELRDIVRKNFREINRRVETIDREMAKKSTDGTAMVSDFVQSQRQKFESLTKTAGKTQYKNKVGGYRILTGNVSKMNEKQLKAIIRQQRAFLSSQYSTKKGRDEVMRKRYETFKQHTDISYSQYKKLADVFNMKEVKALTDTYRWSSGDTMELMESVSYNKNKLVNGITFINDFTNEYPSIPLSPLEIRNMIALRMRHKDASMEEIYDKAHGIQPNTAGSLSETKAQT